MFFNKSEALHVSANDRKATNISNEMLRMYYVRMLSCKGQNISF
jgi:hypothetical protein